MLSNRGTCDEFDTEEEALLGDVHTCTRRQANKEEYRCWVEAQSRKYDQDIAWVDSRTLQIGHARFVVGQRLAMENSTRGRSQVVWGTIQSFNAAAGTVTLLRLPKVIFGNTITRNIHTIKENQEGFNAWAKHEKSKRPTQLVLQPEGLPLNRNVPAGEVCLPQITIELKRGGRVVVNDQFGDTTHATPFQIQRTVHFKPPGGQPEKELSAQSQSGRAPFAELRFDQVGVYSICFKLLSPDAFRDRYNNMKAIKLTRKVISSEPVTFLILPAAKGLHCLLGERTPLPPVEELFRLVDQHGNSCRGLQMSTIKIADPLGKLDADIIDGW